MFGAVGAMFGVQAQEEPTTPWQANVAIRGLSEVEQGRYPISQPLSPVSNPGGGSAMTSGSQSPVDHLDQQQRITWGLSPEPTEEIDPAPSLHPNDAKQQQQQQQQQQKADLNAWQAVQVAVQACQAAASTSSTRERELNKALARLEPSMPEPSDDREVEGSSDAAQARNDRACDVVISPQLQVGGSATVIRGSEAFVDVWQTAGSSGELSRSIETAEPMTQVKEQGSSDTQTPNAPLPTAGELRKGLVELQSLLVDLKDQRRSREEEPTLQAEGVPGSDVSSLELLQALKAELYQEREERRNLQEELAYSEDSEQHCAALVEELKTQICMERGHHASELSSAAAQEATAVAEIRREFQLEHVALHEKLTFMTGQEAMAASASSTLNAECGRLNSELAESSRAHLDQHNVADLHARCKSLSGEASDLASALNAAKAVARHEAAAVGQLRAEQAAAVAELRAERDQLILQEEAAASAQVALQTQDPSRSSATGRFDQSAAARREHQLRSSLAAAENQLLNLRNNQQQENSRMEMQADSLERDLEHGKLVAAQHWKRNVELECDVERLAEENRRLHELLIAELSAADDLVKATPAGLVRSSANPAFPDPALVSFADRRARFNALSEESQLAAPADSVISPPSGPPPNRVPVQRHQGERAVVAAVAGDEEANQGSGDAAAGGTQLKRRVEGIETSTTQPQEGNSLNVGDTKVKMEGITRQPLPSQPVGVPGHRAASISLPTAANISRTIGKDVTGGPSLASPTPKMTTSLPTAKRAAATMTPKTQQHSTSAMYRKSTSPPASQPASRPPSQPASAAGTPAAKAPSSIRVVPRSTLQQLQSPNGARIEPQRIT